MTFEVGRGGKAWMPGTRPGMTRLGIGASRRGRLLAEVAQGGNGLSLLDSPSAAETRRFHEVDGAFRRTFAVMAGLVPAIHAAPLR